MSAYLKATSAVMMEISNTDHRNTLHKDIRKSETFVQKELVQFLCDIVTNNIQSLHSRKLSNHIKSKLRSAPIQRMSTPQKE